MLSLVKIFTTGKGHNECFSTDGFIDSCMYYRGYRNLQAIFSHLNQEKGLTSATDVILTGCSGINRKNNSIAVKYPPPPRHDMTSMLIVPNMHAYMYIAGGLAVLLHADFVSTLIPADATYRALPDAG